MTSRLTPFVEQRSPMDPVLSVSPARVSRPEREPQAERVSRPERASVAARASRFFSAPAFLVPVFSRFSFPVFSAVLF